MFIIKSISVEYRNKVIGLDVKRPRISWIMESEERGTTQSAYRIQVSKEDETFSNLVWDSGKICSDESIQIPYSGEELESRTRYYYRVKAWDNNKVESEWSYVDYWETTFMEYSEWKANWITPDYDYTAPKTACPILRKKFEVKSPIKRARIYVTAKGLYELYLNGEKVGEDLLTPGWTSYNKRHLYQTYDVTSILKEGDNALATIIGSGWYKGEVGWRARRNLYGGREALILELHIQYEDRKEEVILSDGSWKSSYHGPIVYAEIYHGETFDATRLPGWNRVEFDDSRWFGVRIMGRVTKSVLKAQECESVRIKEVIKPVGLIMTPKGEKVLDMGQNMTGWVRFKVEGERGSRVVLSHAEILDGEGNFYTDNLKGAKQRIEYTLSGEGKEIFRPHFTFQGFRYVKIEEFPGTPSLDDFEGLVLYSDLEQTGTFECSDGLINQLQHNILWGQRGNFVDIPTDCPQRCERLGWTGDIQIFAKTAAFNMRIPLFLTKWLRDLAAEQFESGGVPWVVPDIYDDTYAYDLAGYIGQSEQVAAAWGDAATICPWTMYLAYNDKQLLVDQYESMKAYVEYIKNEGDNPYLWNTGHQLGDWVALDAPYGSFIGATDVEYVATAYYAYSTKILYKTAKLLGKTRDYLEFKALYKNIVEAFRNEYVLESGELKVKTQTAIILAVYFDLVEDDVKQLLVDKLAKWLQDTNYDLITGFVGTPYICHVLSEHGHQDTAYKLLLKKEYPSWLYQVTKGATTIWEHLDGMKPDGTLWNPRMNSFNHYAYGSVGEWLYSGIAGLILDENKTAYKHFYFKPTIKKYLSFARASIDSMHGQINVEWKKYDNKTSYYINIPVNTTATIQFTNTQVEKIKENGLPLEEVKGILEVEETEKGVSVLAGSGIYNFVFE